MSSVLSQDKEEILFRQFRQGCFCALTLRPTCIDYLIPGCRERRRWKKCAHPKRLLPVCVARNGLGCHRRQLGQRCDCRERRLPSCLALGCEKRQEGHQCQCSRWPGPPCRHVQALWDYYRELTPEQAIRLARRWRKRLETEFIRDFLEPLVGVPERVFDQESRVRLMANRQSMGVSLWHPRDVRNRHGMNQTEERHARAQAEQKRLELLRKILGVRNHGGRQASGD